MCSPNRKKWSPKSVNVEPKLLVCFCYGSAVQASALLTSLLWVPFEALKPGFRSLAALKLAVNVVGDL